LTADLRAQLQKSLGDAYRLERELGGGGMSRVFEAEDVRLKRRVAIKVLSPDLAQGLSVERFEREIQTAAALQQANIVPVLSAGDTEGLPFYTMPFVEGESLRAHLARGPLAITAVIGVLRDVSKALAYAHRHGVVHRDIKPDNVLLSEGTAVVTDFGIAKAISAARTASGAATLTQVGTSIGTPAYMAPEQAAGDPNIDHRADIYSLGAMAFELLAGQPVFADRTPQRMLAAHMGETPRPITDLRSDLPASLAELVMRCLAKSADDRPQAAADIVRVLETITSGGGMPAMPPILLGGPGMFRKALAIYAVAFVVVAVLAKAAIVGIGLPDWVFPGSLGVMALVLPVVLWTGYVHRVTHRALTMTPTYTPGGTPSMGAHGTMATMALKAAPHVSWYTTARGGAYALGTFIVVIAAFMFLRATGIGPFGSLLAAGRLGATDRILLTDFSVSGADSSLGRVVSDAVRAGLSESRVLTLVPATEVAGALQRMQRRASTRIDLALARQIAQREGFKAIVDGDVTLVGTSYIVAARLVTADSGVELASYRATAKGSDAIIDAADELARKLRAKAGESLRRVQRSMPLEQVTTGSIEALRLYSEGFRANSYERNFGKAVRLLRDAVAIDTTFAEAWRLLANAMGNAGLPASSRDSAFTRAYQLRERLPSRERNRITATYFFSGPGRDRARAATVYEAMLSAGDSGPIGVNYAILLSTRREFAKAETIATAGLRRTNSQLAFTRVLYLLLAQGKLQAFDSALIEARRRFPGAPFVAEQLANGQWARGDVPGLRHGADSALGSPDSRNSGFGFRWAASDALTSGQLRRWRELLAQRRSPDSPRGVMPSHLDAAIDEVGVLAAHGIAGGAELAKLDAALATAPLEMRAAEDRPYLYLASVFAHVGRPDRARAVLARYRSDVKDTALLRSREPSLHNVLGTIARAERKWTEAVREFRLSDQLPDGPATDCVECLANNLIITFAEANMPDSALAEYDRYRRTPYGARALVGPDLALGARVTETLAKLYDARGDTARAVQHYRWFVELWKNADPELQPRVAEARRRIVRVGNSIAASRRPT